jgi:hypothetical protein
MAKLSYTFGFPKLLLDESLLDLGRDFCAANRGVTPLHSRRIAATFLILAAAATRVGIVPANFRFAPWHDVSLWRHKYGQFMYLDFGH